MGARPPRRRFCRMVLILGMKKTSARRENRSSSLPDVVRRRGQALISFRIRRQIIKPRRFFHVRECHLHLSRAHLTDALADHRSLEAQSPASAASGSAAGRARTRPPGSTSGDSAPRGGGGACASSVGAPKPPAWSPGPATRRAVVDDGRGSRSSTTSTSAKKSVTLYERKVPPLPPTIPPPSARASPRPAHLASAARSAQREAVVLS